LKQLVLFLLFLVPAFAFAGGDTLSLKTISSRDSLVLNHSIDSLENAIVSYSATFLKSPYRYGGHSRKGFDCSGFVSTVYKNFGITLPHSSKGMYTTGQPIELQDVRKGDLLLFKNTNHRRKGIGHVAIVTEARDGNIVFIHSATHLGVRYDNLSAPYYTKHYYQAIRLVLPDSLKVK